jgi:predicted metal-binding protein
LNYIIRILTIYGSLNMDKKYYVDLALQLEADHAVIFNIEDIEFDSRTLLKCMFGCNDWGKGHTCPSRPNSLRPWEYEAIFKKYSWGVIVHSRDKKISQEVSFALEKEAFFNGHYFAFSLSDCACCKECTGFKDQACANPQKARPAFHSVGIDVFRTVRKFDLPISTLREKGEEQNWYSAVFVE